MSFKVGDWVKCILGRPSMYGGPQPGEIFQVISTWTNSFDQQYIGIKVPNYKNNVTENLSDIRNGKQANWLDRGFRALTPEELHSINFANKMEDIIND